MYRSKTVLRSRPVQGDGRGVAQSGSAVALGATGRRFDPGRPDQPPITPEISARFWAKVEKRGPDECWPWTASTTRGGYGDFKLPGQKVVASRYAYFLATHHWPGRYLVCHACDNPPCCNPAHLWLGLHSDNSRDKIAKGRARTGDQRGSRNPKAKLTEADIIEIRRLIGEGMTNTAIGPMFGVTHSAISLIRLGRFWKHVDADALPLFASAGGR